MCIYIASKIRNHKHVEQTIQSLPQFHFQDIHFSDFHSSELNKNQACMIYYFHPDCDYCQNEVDQIFVNMERFVNHQIVMISPTSRERIYDFAKTRYLLEMDNLILLVDTLNHFQQIFGPNPFPTSFIYNKERKLVKQFKGEVKIEALLKYLYQ